MMKEIKLNKTLWFITSFLTLIVSFIGSFFPSIYDKVVSDEIMAGTIGQDITAFILALISLFLIFTIKEKDIVKQIILIGFMGFLFYAYGTYAIERIYNPLYFIYMMIFSLSFFTIIYNLLSIKIKNIEIILSKTKRIIYASFSLFIPIMFYIIWTIMLIPLIQKADRIEYLYAIFVLDLCFIMPSMIIIAYLTFKNRTLGLLLTPIIYILGGVLLLPVGLAELFKPVFDSKINYPSMVLFTTLSIIFIIMSIMYFLSINIKFVEKDE